jgi:YVTN family beta-propeller protein
MEFRILGPLEVRDGDRSVPLGGPKQRALLGVLLLHANEVVSAARLVDELWGERPPATAEKLVQGYVHGLRRQLGADTLVTQPPGYRIELDSSTLDLLEFQRLTEEARTGAPDRAVELRRRALALWHGPALADVLFEGPARHELGRLGDLRLTTQIERIDDELELGRHERVIGELESLVAAHPYQERLHAQLMLALYRSGRQAEALALYRAMHALLADELGLEPDQQLQELNRRILNHDQRLDLPQPEAPVEPRDPAPATPPESRERVRMPVGVVPPPKTADAPVPKQVRRWRSRRAVAVGAAILALAAGAALVARGGDAGPPVLEPDSLAVIDPSTNRVVDAVAVGSRPARVAIGLGSIWVANAGDRTVSRVDPASRKARTIPSGTSSTLTTLAVGEGFAWVGAGIAGRTVLARISPEFNRVVQTREFRRTGFRLDVGWPVAVGEGAVWAAGGRIGTVLRLHPRTMRTLASVSLGIQPVTIAVGEGGVWVANRDNTVVRIDPRTNEATASATVAPGSAAIAVGEGAVWVAAPESDAVTRIDPVSAGVRTIDVGDRPSGIAVGQGAVWVANAGDGTVMRIDPDTRRVTATIPLGVSPEGIAVGHGAVWVTAFTALDSGTA